VWHGAPILYVFIHTVCNPFFLLCIIDLVYGNFTLSVTENTWSVSNLVIINTEVFHVHKMYRSILMSGVGLQFPVLFFS